MPTLKETNYTAWDFSADEEPLAVCFSDLQKKHLQTEMMAVVNARAELAYDTSVPNSIEEYLRAMEYNRGRLEMLQFLIELSDAKQNELLELIRQQQSNQELN